MGRSFLARCGCLAVSLLLSVTLAIGCLQPTPGPTPIPPVPPIPVPIPTPIPVSVPGLHVLLLYDSTVKLSDGHQGVFSSTKLVDLLNVKCKGADGSVNWRKWDISSLRETGVANESAGFQTIWPAIKDTPAAATLPSLVICVKTGCSNPAFPTDEAAALKLIGDL